MPAAVKAFGATNDILAGRGDVTLPEALAALAGTAGLCAFAVKIKLWPKLNEVERKELEMLDQEMPAGFWHKIREVGPVAAFMGRKVRWHHCDGYMVTHGGDGDLEIGTPMLNEETGELV
jgi:hypothetical protein